jgi:hypothetical protein
MKCYLWHDVWELMLDSVIVAFGAAYYSDLVSTRTNYCTLSRYYNTYRWTHTKTAYVAWQSSFSWLACLLGFIALLFNCHSLSYGRKLIYKFNTLALIFLSKFEASFTTVKLSPRTRWASLFIDNCIPLLILATQETRCVGKSGGIGLLIR